MNILSLFDGISCGQIALNRAKIPYHTYYAAEIDKHAIKVTQANYPNTVQIGDVTKWKEWDIDWGSIGLVLAGSPCQGFSFAGKQLAFDDPRSALFFTFVEIWQQVKNHNPDANYLLENVKMAQEHELVISRYMGVHPIEINSALVSAQNRQRLYWTSIANQPYGLFGDMACMIPQPQDNGLLLRDILENDVLDKYYLSEKMLAYFKNRAANFNQGKVNVREEQGKASCLTSSMASCDISDNFIKVDTNLKASKNQKKANCFTAGGNSGGLHSDMTLIVASRGRNPENPKSREIGLNTEQHLEPKFDGKTNCLTSVQKDNLVITKRIKEISPYQGDKLHYSDEKMQCLSAQGGNKLRGIGFAEPDIKSGTWRTHEDGKGFREIKSGKAATIPARAREDGSGQNVVAIPEATKKGYAEINPGECFDATFPESKTRRGRLMEDKSNCLTATKYDFMHYDTNYRIRRLTPVECERLQTVKDNYTAHVSDTQRYKALGNGWTVDVIVHILNYINV